jgi:hypothetical protein
MMQRFDYIIHSGRRMLRLNLSGNLAPELGLLSYAKRL